MAASRVESTYPLSPMQQGMLYHHLSGNHAGVDIEQIVCVLHEKLNVPAFQQAWDHTVRRHSTLRTALRWDGRDKPVQEVYSKVAIPLAVKDCRNAPAEEKEQEFDDFLATDQKRGFDLSEPPLVRLSLFRMDEVEYWFVWTLHHVLMDGRSFPVVLQDVFAYYGAFCRNEEVEFPPPRPFEDHIAWLGARDRSNDERFWSPLLKGFDEPTRLPGVHASTKTLEATEQRGEQHVRLSKTTTDTLRDLARAHGFTLNTLVQGAWAILLCRYSGEDHVLFGATRACRKSGISGADAVAGVFINTLPVAVHIDHKAPLVRWLRELRAQQVSIREYEHTPLVDIHRWSGIAPSIPIFESILVFDNATLDTVLGRLNGTKGGREFRLLERTNFPITVYGYAEPELLLKIAYDRERFDDATIGRMLRHLQTLLHGMADDPNRTIAALPSLTDRERHQQIVEWNATVVDFPRDRCVHELIEDQVHLTPDQVAAVFEDDEITYHELNTRANQLARHLQKLGVGPDVLVGICVERSLDMLVGLLGILKAGGAYVPLDPSYPTERLAFMLEDADVSVLLTQAGLVNRLPATNAKVLILDAGSEAAAQEDGEDLKVDVAPENLAYVIYTSGSTGKPKGVMIEHRNVVNFFQGMDERVTHDLPGVWLAVTNLSFDISVLELFWTLARGFKLVIYADRDMKRETSAVRSRPPKRVDFSLFYFASGEGGKGEDKYRLLLEGAKFADEHGFSAVWTPERHFHAFGGLYPNPSVTSAAIAALTRQIQIRAGSVVLPLHDPIRVAEEWALVDNLSNGRVGVSFASGWQPNDFALAPGNYEDRKALLYRSIETVRKLWKGEPVEFPGPSGEPVAVKTLPRPIQPDLPVWVTTAGSVDTYRSAGAIGANVLTHMLGQSVDELRERIAAYREARRDNGHNPDSGRVTLMLHTFLGQDRDWVRETVRQPMTDYLRSSMGLVKNLAGAWTAFSKRAKRSKEAQGDEFQKLSPEDTESLLTFAFERYFETSGLFGTPESCMDMVEQLRAAGVDEIACLIDFGVETDAVLEHLVHLDSLRVMVNDKVEVDAERYTFARQIRRHHVTHVQCTPSMARMLIADKESRGALASLEVVLVGGEVFPESLGAELCALVGGEVINMYGPTETTIWSSTQVVRDSDESIAIGRPVANTEFYVLDEYRQPLPVGVAGELYIGGAGVARGYLRRPALTAERFVRHPFSAGPDARLYRTGDVARYQSDGTVDFLGRTDHQIKIRGHRVELGEIEAVMAHHPALREALVVARGDDTGGPALTGYYVPVTGASPTDEELRRFVKDKLPEFMIPSAFFRLESLPVTPNGKIDRSDLPVPGVARPEHPVSYVAPTTAIEETLSRIWSEVLGYDRIGVHDNFFELGGNSLSTIQIAVKIREVFQVDLPLRTVFAKPTIAEIAGDVEETVLAQADDVALVGLLEEIDQLSHRQAKDGLAADVRSRSTRP